MEIEQMINELNKILSNQNPEIKPKDNFKNENPNYRNFTVDPTPPIINTQKKNKR
jgi:hypothetical protein